MRLRATPDKKLRNRHVMRFHCPLAVLRILFTYFIAGNLAYWLQSVYVKHKFDQAPALHSQFAFPCSI